MRKLIVLAGALLAVNVAFGQVKAAAPASKETSKPPQATEAQLQLDQKLAELKTLQAEIERLRRAIGAGSRQIMVKVQVMKVSRTRLEQLGYELGDGGVAGLLNRDGKAPVDADTGKAKATPKATGPKPLDSATIAPGDRYKALIAAWKKEGIIVEVVAEPTVVTVSGRPAYFHVGGQFPFLVPVPGGRMKTEMRPFGVQLDVLPLLLDDGRVRLELRPRVSEIDETRAVTVNGVTTPGLRVREIDTGVELQPGETFAISGYGQWVKAKAKPDPSLPDAAAEHVELLVLAKVELVDPMLPSEE
ncbi:MAG TPA: hypothetical protein VN699_19270 [Pirellulales bacterium]|nr:hypothetical protein [Pirellulales bacterium]